MADNSAFEGDIPTKDGYNTFGIAEEGPSEQDDVREKERARRDQNPLWNCALIAKYPKTCFGITLFLHLASVFCLFILLVPGYDILPTDVGEVYIDVRDNEDFLRRLAWEHRNDDSDVIQRVDNQMERTERGDGVEYHFQCKGGCNVLTPENMRKMADVENKLNETEKFQKLCWRIAVPTEIDCVPPLSLIRLFDGTINRLTQESTYSDPDFERIPEILAYALESENTFVREIMARCLPKDFKIDVNASIAEAEIVRGYVVFGLPLADYSSTHDRRKQQNKIVNKFLEDEYETKVLQKYYEKGEDGDLGDLRFYYTAETLFFKFFDYIIYQDMYYVIGSFLFIFVFLLLSTCSIFVTIFTSGSLLTAFCITNLIYRFMLNIKYFGNIHFLVVFVVLGIGVDDIFIFTITWNQTGQYQYKSLAHRLSDCYRRTALPMFFTSATTIISFCVSIASQLLTISTLAAFGAIYMAVIYLSVIIYFPCVMIMYHIYFEKYAVLCFLPREDWNEETKDFDNKEKQTCRDQCCGGNFLVRFFRGPYHWFVTNVVCAGFILLLIAGVIAVFGYYASTVDINIDLITINPFRAWNNYGKFLDRRNELFPEDVNPVKVYLTWGLKKQDLSSCSRTDQDCEGEVVYDDNFNLASLENQQALLNLCDRLKNLPKKDVEKLHIKMNGNDTDVKCFMSDMQAFYTTIDPLNVNAEPTRSVCTIGQPNTNPQTDFTFRYFNPFIPGALPPDLALPSDSTKAELVMNQTVLNGINVYDGTAFDGADFNNWFEIQMTHWLYGGFPTRIFEDGTCIPAYTMTLVPELLAMPEQFRAHHELLGEVETEHTQHAAHINQLGIDYKYRYGTKLRYAAIVVTTTLKRSLQYGKGLPIRNDWEDFMDEQLRDMPSDLKNGFQATPGTDMWHLLWAQKALITTAWWGIGIGLAVVFVLLVIGTLNILTAAITTFIISLTVLVIVGFLPMYDSYIDIFETVVLTLIVGVSADYSIHMALAYSRSLHTLRKERIRDALGDIGLSITSGVLTTLGACLFMFFAVLTFFPEFGGILFVTMAFAWLSSILFLPALLGLIGPQHNFMSLRPLCKCCGCSDETSSQKYAKST